MPVIQSGVAGSTRGLGTSRSNAEVVIKNIYGRGSINIGPTLSADNVESTKMITDGVDFYTWNNTNIYKTDGKSPWSVQGTPAAAPSNNASITYGKGVFVDGTGRYSLDKCRTWTASPSSIKPNYGTVSFSNGYFVGTYWDSASNHRVLVSTDGINWDSYLQSSLQLATSYLFGVKFTGVNFLSGTGGAWRYGTSPNPALQATPSGSLPGNGYGVTSVCVAPIGSAHEGTIIMGEVSSSQVHVSTNHGATFISVNNGTGVGFPPGPIFYLNGYFLIIDYNATRRIAYSTNGTTWTTLQNQLPALTDFYMAQHTNCFAEESGNWIAMDYSTPRRTMVGSARTGIPLLDAPVTIGGTYNGMYYPNNSFAQDNKIFSWHSFGNLKKVALATNTLSTILTVSGISQYPATTRYQNNYITIGGVGNSGSTAYYYNIVTDTGSATAMTNYPINIGRGSGDYLDGYGAYIFGGATDGETPTTATYYWNGSSWTSSVATPSQIDIYTGTYAASPRVESSKVYVTDSSTTYEFNGSTYKVVSSNTPNVSGRKTTLAGKNHLVIVIGPFTSSGTDSATTAMYYRQIGSDSSSLWTLLGYHPSNSEGYPLAALDETGSVAYVGLGGYGTYGNTRLTKISNL